MKHKYYLGRLFSGSLQLSSDSYSSYKKADDVRKRQVNPSHWFVVVNPSRELTQHRRMNMKDVEEQHWKKLKDAYKLLQEIVY